MTGEGEGGGRDLGRRSAIRPHRATAGRDRRLGGRDDSEDATWEGLRGLILVRGNGPRGLIRGLILVRDRIRMAYGARIRRACGSAASPRRL
jgi:hypothetical protein